MPAGITETDGMAYVGRRPWHDLGTYVEGEAMTAAQAIEAANLDWEVVTEPVYRHIPAGDWMPRHIKQIEGKRAVVRQDTGEVFGIMTERYTPIQNRAAFDLMDAIVGAGDATYHTIGSLHGGRRVWLLCRLQGDYTLDNGEKLESYVLLDNSHDGTSALRMRLTQIRVVCANTLGAATGKQAAFYSRHTSGIMDRANEARDLLGLNAAYMERFMAQANRIAEERFSSFDMERFTRTVLDLDPDKELDRQHGVKATAGLKLMELYRYGVGNSGETRWDALNAVTEYLDYSKGGRSVDSLDSVSDTAVNRRLENSWFGSGNQMRERAWDILTQPVVR